MSNIKHEQLSDFQQRLKEASRAQSPLYSVQEVVTKAFTAIDQARQRNVPWEEIAKMLNESTAKNLSVQTVKNYYFRVKKAQKETASQQSEARPPKAQSIPRKPPTQATTQAIAPTEASISPASPTESGQVEGPAASVASAEISEGDRTAPRVRLNVEDELERPEPESNQATSSDSNGFGHQQQTEDPAWSGSSPTEKSRFNFNSVRPEV